MGPSLSQLLSVAHRALSAERPRLSPSITSEADGLASELADLLAARNGFYAFGAALHVFPYESTELSWGLVE